MYHYANRPGLSTQASRQTIAQFFNTSVNGLPGNDGVSDARALVWPDSPDTHTQTRVQWAAMSLSTSRGCIRCRQPARSFCPLRTSARSLSQTLSLGRLPRSRSRTSAATRQVVRGATSLSRWASISGSGDLTCLIRSGFFTGCHCRREAVEVELLPRLGGIPGWVDDRAGAYY